MRSTIQNILATFGGTTQAPRISSFTILDVFAADKSMSDFLGRPICLGDEIRTVNFLKELDDECVLASASGSRQ